MPHAVRERIDAESRPPVVVEDEEAVDREKAPRQRGVDEHVQREVRSVDVHEVESGTFGMEVDQHVLRVAYELAYAGGIDRGHVRVEPHLEILGKQVARAELGAAGEGVDSRDVRVR